MVTEAKMMTGRRKTIHYLQIVIFLEPVKVIMNRIYLRSDSVREMILRLHVKCSVFDQVINNSRTFRE